MGQGEDPKLEALEKQFIDLDRLKGQVVTLEQTINNPDREKPSKVRATEIARALVTTPELLSKVVNEIVGKRFETIGNQTAQDLMSKPGFKDLLAQKLSSNTKFTSSITKTLADNPANQTRFQGQKGYPGNLESLTGGANSVQQALSSKDKPRIFWCENGQDDLYCKIPIGKDTISFQPSFMNTWGISVDGVTMVDGFTEVKKGGNNVAYMDSSGNVVGNRVGTHGWDAYLEGGTAVAKKGIKVGKWIIYQDDYRNLAFNWSTSGQDLFKVQPDKRLWSKEYGYFDENFSPKTHKHGYWACTNQWKETDNIIEK